MQIVILILQNESWDANIAESQSWKFFFVLSSHIDPSNCVNYET